MTVKEAILTLNANVVLACERAGFSSATVKMIEDALNTINDALEENGKPDCEHAEHDGIGCLGYSGCTQDDEPIESCARCAKYTGNVYEEEVKRE